jgi:uncharacterized FlgJ-related protein
MKYFLSIILLLIFIDCKAPCCNLSTNEKIQLYEQLIIEREIKREILLLEQSEFTYDNLVRYLTLTNVESKEIVLRQSILETGWFKSSLFKKGNNLFGMRVPKVRETASNGSYFGHARYDHWTDSVKDIILWQEYYKNKGKSFENYYKFLEEVNYATASNYINTLKKIKLK